MEFFASSGYLAARCLQSSFTNFADSELLKAWWTQSCRVGRLGSGLMYDFETPNISLHCSIPKRRPTT